MCVSYSILLCLMANPWCSALNSYWKKFPYSGPVTLNYYSLIQRSSVIRCIVTCWPLYNWDQIYFQGENCYCLAPVYEEIDQVSGTVTTKSEFWTIHQDASSCSIKNYTIFAENKYCLKYVPIKGIYEDAEGQCRKDGGHLMSVHRKQDDTHFRSLYEDEKFVQIGGHRTLDGAKFAWITGGYVNDTFWGRDEPNNMGGEEDCVSVKWNGGYNDVRCSAMDHFFCQILTK